MLKVTHILRQDETKVAKMIANFLKKNYKFYFEVKVMGDGLSSAYTEKFTAKDDLK